MRGEGVKHQKRKLPLQKFTKGKNYTSKKKTFRDPSTIWHFLFTTRHPNKKKPNFYQNNHSLRTPYASNKIIIQSYEDLIRCVSNPRWFSETRNFESRKLVEFIRKYLKIFESDPDILLAPSLYPSQSLESQKSFRKSCKNFRICIWVENNYSKYPRYIIYRIKQHFTKDQIKIETNSGNFKGIIVIKILELLQFQSPPLLKHFTKIQ